MPRELKPEPVQKLGSASNVHLIRRMYHQFETPMVMSVTGGDPYQSSSNFVIHRIIDRAKTVQMRHTVVVHVNGDRPNKPTQRLGDPKMILRPTEICFLNLIDIRGAITIHQAAGSRSRMQPQYRRTVSGLKASDPQSIERAALLVSFRR